MESNDEKIKEMNRKVKKMTGNTFHVTAKDPDYMKDSLPQSHKTFRKLPIHLQKQFSNVELIQGKAHGYVFQMSHGSMQIKKYDPEKYKNDVNTPLRIRARKIMRIAGKEPKDKQAEKMRELFSNYPYHLRKGEPVNLRMKNFYFPRKVITGNIIRIYKASSPEHPNPATDQLYIETEYKEKSTIQFVFQDVEEEYFYAVNQRNGDISNVLKFVWE